MLETKSKSKVEVLSVTQWLNVSYQYQNTLLFNY